MQHSPHGFYFDDTDPETRNPRGSSMPGFLSLRSTGPFILNAATLAQAFPEMAPVARKRVRALRREVSDCWMPFAIAIEEAQSLKDSEEMRATSRSFWREVVKLYIHHDPRTRELKLLEAYLKLVKAPAAAAPGPLRHNVEQARAVPIESIHSFERIKSAGQRAVARCPFHAEKTASFTIYRGTNTYHCFGCGEHGDVIAFVMKLYNKTFIESVEYLGG